MGDIYGLSFWSPLPRNPEDAWAIAPYSSQMSLSHVPLYEAEDNINENNSEVENGIDEAFYIEILGNEDLGKHAMSLEDLECMESCGIAAKEKNVQIKVIA